MTPDQIIEVVTAFKNGKKIQSRANTSVSSYKWLDNPCPVWDFSGNEYRVAPEPKVIWTNEYEEGTSCGYLSRDEALQEAEYGAVKKAVKYIEVIED